MNVRGKIVGAAGVLGAATALAHVLGYAFTLVVSRALGPDDFGALAALLGLGLLGAVPAAALQVVVARRRAAEPGGGGSEKASLLIGLALAALVIAASPALVALLHLPSGWALVWLGLTLVPMTLTGAVQGELLGSGRAGGLAAVYATTATLRFGAGAAAAVLGFGVTGVVAASAIATTAAAAVAVWVARPGRRSTAVKVRSLLPELTGSTLGLTGLLLLTSVDVLLARHFLQASTSGEYALAALFGKAVFWATQFIALLLVPHVAATHASVGPAPTGVITARRALGVAAGVVVSLGLAASAVVFAFSEQLTVLAGGSEFVNAAALVGPFTLLGTLWALAQVLLFSDLARTGQLFGRLLWAAAGLEVLLVVVWLHDTPGQILLAAAVAATALVLVGAGAALRQAPERLTPSTREVIVAETQLPAG